MTSGFSGKGPEAVRAAADALNHTADTMDAEAIKAEELRVAAEAAAVAEAKRKAAEADAAKHIAGLSGATPAATRVRPQEAQPAPATKQGPDWKSVVIAVLATALFFTFIGVVIWLASRGPVAAPPAPQTPVVISQPTPPAFAPVITQTQNCGCCGNESCGRAQSPQRPQPEKALPAPPANKKKTTRDAPKKCENNCEVFTGVRREVRNDKLCVIQTNIGYRIRVGKDKTSDNLVAMLVDQQDQRISTVKPIYVPGATFSGDCTKDQEQTTNKETWEKVRSRLGLGSACDPKA